MGGFDVELPKTLAGIDGLVDATDGLVLIPVGPTVTVVVITVGGFVDSVQPHGGGGGAFVQPQLAAVGVCGAAEAGDASASAPAVAKVAMPAPAMPSATRVFVTCMKDPRWQWRKGRRPG